MGKAIIMFALACCYVSGALLPGTVRAAPPTAAAANTVSGASIVETALKYVGYPYTTAGNTPATGFSCIGYVSYVYQRHGIPLPDELGLAQAYAPTVPFSDLLAGDILFFQNTAWTGLSHTAIYLGGGRFVHAEWYNRGVRVSSFYNDPVDGNYWIGKYLSASRPWEGSFGVVALSALSSSQSDTGVVTRPLSDATTTVLASPPMANGSSAVVIVPALNLRAGPSKRAAVRQILKRGMLVVVGVRQGDWYQITVGAGGWGWVIKSGIGQPSGVATVPKPAPTAGAGTSPGVYYPKIAVPVDQLRVHTAPELLAAVVGVLRKGQIVEVLTQTHSWDRVRIPSGTVGWVSAPLIESRVVPGQGPHSRLVHEPQGIVRSV